MLTTTARPRAGATPGRRPPAPPAADPRFSLPSDAWPTAALAVLTASSFVGFSRIFVGHTWIGPVLVTLAGVHLLCWALRRWHVPLTAALVLGAAAAWLLPVWTVLGPYTHAGIPGPGTWHHFTAALSQARTDISVTSAPVAATPGFRLLAALGAGLVALLGDAIAFRWRYVLLGVTPAFAMFVVCCTSGQGRGRGAMIGAFVAGLLLYLLAQRAPGGATGQVWFAGVHSGAGAWTLRVGAIVGAAAVVASVLVAPLMHGEDGVGALGWRSGIGPGGGGTRTVANPIVDLQTRLIQLSNTPVFTVQSSIPSYWRLTSLDTYTGSTWISTGSYRGFRTTLPGTRPLGTRQIQEHFVIDQLGSVWLPSAFNPFKVDGVHDVTYDPNSNSLITSQQTSDGLSYTVTSYQYLSTLNASDLRAAPSSFSVPSEYTALPDTVPSAVRTLAQALTAGKATEYDKALAIQNYLLSPKYHYNLQPPFDGTGNYAISNFLFQTFQGYCQQFAGAYAVLARLAGLPTRLAVGFATGTYQNGVYHVTDAQAHTWPEVYFGPQYGWIPFEPTPGFTAPGTGGYESSTPSPQPTQPTPTTTAPSSPTTTIGPKSGTNPHRTTPTSVAHSGSRGTRSKGVGAGWLTVLGLLAAGVIWLGFNVGWRRVRWARRRRRYRSLGPEGEVLASWADTDEVMTWVGLGRQPSETFDEYARRVTERIAWMSTEDTLSSAVTRMAALAGVAAFAPGVPEGAPDEARSLAASIRRAVFHAATFRRRLVWALVPRPGYRSSSV